MNKKEHNELKRKEFKKSEKSTVCNGFTKRFYFPFRKKC